MILKKKTCAGLREREGGRERERERERERGGRGGERERERERERDCRRSRLSTKRVTLHPTPPETGLTLLRNPHHSPASVRTGRTTRNQRCLLGWRVDVDIALTGEERLVWLDPAHRWGGQAWRVPVTQGPGQEQDENDTDHWSGLEEKEINWRLWDAFQRRIQRISCFWITQLSWKREGFAVSGAKHVIALPVRYLQTKQPWLFIKFPLCFHRHR